MPEIGPSSASAVQSVPLEQGPERIQDPTSQAIPAHHTFQNGRKLCHMCVSEAWVSHRPAPFVMVRAFEMCPLIVEG